MPPANPTIVALTLLLVVLFVAAWASRWAAVAVSVVAMLAFNFFFLPPIGTFTIADPQNVRVGELRSQVTCPALCLQRQHLGGLARTPARGRLGGRRAHNGGNA
jgi:hypothetical protein